ncbi:hypothetical protein [Terrabacter terrigena]
MRSRSGGTSTTVSTRVLALVVGACLGWACGILGERIEKVVDGHPAAGPAEPADPITPAAA